MYSMKNVNEMGHKSFCVDKSDHVSMCHMEPKNPGQFLKVFELSNYESLRKHCCLLKLTECLSVSYSHVFLHCS